MQNQLHIWKLETCTIFWMDTKYNPIGYSKIFWMGMIIWIHNLQHHTLHQQIPGTYRYLSFWSCPWITNCLFQCSCIILSRIQSIYKVKTKNRILDYQTYYQIFIQTRISRFSGFAVCGWNGSMDDWLSRGVYSSIIRPKHWGIIFPLWGRIPSFGKKKKESSK